MGVSKHPQNSLCQSPGAPITQHHKLGSLKQQNVVSLTVSEAESAPPAGQVPSEAGYEAFASLEHPVAAVKPWPHLLKATVVLCHCCPLALPSRFHILIRIPVGLD